jgi:hypothetical protein
MKMQDKVRIKDSGKKKKVVSTSTNATDTSYSSTKDVKVTKPNSTKEVKKSFFNSMYSAGGGSREGSMMSSVKKTKETPKKSMVSTKIKTDSSAGQRSDSSYKEVVRKPTEKKAGSVKIVAKGPNTNIRTKTSLPKKSK